MNFRFLISNAAELTHLPAVWQQRLKIGCKNYHNEKQRKYFLNKRKFEYPRKTALIYFPISLYYQAQ